MWEGTAQEHEYQGVGITGEHLELATTITNLIRWPKLKNCLIHPSKFSSQLAKELPIGERNCKCIQDKATDILGKLTKMEKISGYLESYKCYKDSTI